MIFISKFIQSVHSLKSNFKAKDDLSAEDLALLVNNELAVNPNLDNFETSIAPLLDRFFNAYPTECQYFLMDNLHTNTPSGLIESNKEKLIEYFLTKPQTFAKSIDFVRHILKNAGQNYYPLVAQTYKLSTEEKLTLLSSSHSFSNWPVIKAQIGDLLLNHSSPIVNSFVLLHLADKILPHLVQEINNSPLSLPFVSPPNYNVSLEEKKQLLASFSSFVVSCLSQPNNPIERSLTKKEIKIFSKHLDSHSFISPIYYASRHNLLRFVIPVFLPILAQFNFKAFEESFLSPASPTFSNFPNENNPLKILEAMSINASTEDFIKLLNQVNNEALPSCLAHCLSIALRHSNFELVDFLNLRKHNTLEAIEYMHPSLTAVGLENLDYFENIDYDLYNVVKSITEEPLSYYLNILKPGPEEKQALIRGAIESQDLLVYKKVSALGVNLKEIHGKIVFDLIYAVCNQINDLDIESPAGLEILKDIWAHENNPDFYLDCHKKGLFILVPALQEFLTIQKEKNYLTQHLPAPTTPATLPANLNKSMKI